MGPLQGITVVEIASIGPGPFCGMVLADLGATVIRIDRAAAVVGGDPGAPPPEPLLRGRRSAGVDLKNRDGVSVVLRLAEEADVLIEGFRPGVAERLGIGPDVCLRRNPRLVYGRMTGWGQEGPLAADAGHDIDYLAVAGALFPIGRPDAPPVPPLNLVADFGGGGMLLALGIAAALVERTRSGRGQVIDAAMVDGAALLSTMLHGMLASGLWSEDRGANLLDGGAPFYDTYETADGRFIAVGALEPQFYDEMLGVLGIDPADLPDRFDRRSWPQLRDRLSSAFRERTRDEWARVFAGSDGCVTPVMTPGEAPDHPHNRHRGTFVEVAGVRQPGPAPRFGRTELGTPGAPPHPGQHTDEVLAEAGFTPEEIAVLRRTGAVR